MASVDNRIVSMEMRNKQFEQGARTSMKTIESLDASLKTLSTAKGLDNINVGFASQGLSAISSGVEAISSRFSMLGQIASTVLGNIVTDAYNTGKSLVSAFTIEPVMSGFSEYQTQINATQTILANTSREGTTLTQVNAALDELNHYADKTIYNFTEMTRNIGTFTAAGVDLDTSVAAIKGIANLAAVSGSNSQQASRAMYQLSQALAAGVVNLQDWNSVVNAGMGGAIFQDALKETAKAMGIVVDESQSFRESLSKETGSGWLTSEVLLETLKKFTGDMTEAELMAKGYTEEQTKAIMQMGVTANEAATKVKTVEQLYDTLKEAAQSGWTQSWQIVIGDFEEAKNVLTEVSDTFSEMINSSSEARNAVLKDWKELGGRNDLIQAFKNIFEAIQSVVLPIKGSFRDIFPPATGKTLADITAKIKDFTAGLKLTYVQSNQLRRAFSGIFAILDIGKQAFSAVAKALKPLVDSLLNLGGSALKNTAEFGDYFVSLRDSLKETDYFNAKIEDLKNFGSKLKAFAANVKQAFLILYEAADSKGLKGFREAFKNIYEIVSGKIKDVFAKPKDVSPLVNNLREFFTNAVAILNNGLKFLKPIADKIGDILGTIGSSIYNTFKNPEFEGLAAIANNVLVGGVIFAVKKFVDILNTISKEGLSGLKKVNDTFKGSLDSIKSIFSGVEDALKSWQDSLKAGTLLKIAGAIAILAASLAVLASLDTERLGTALIAISTMFIELNATLAIFSKITDNTKGFGSTTVVLVGISAAILILASAIKKLGGIDPIDVVKGLSAITILLAELMVVAKLINTSSKGLIKTSAGLVVLAVAVKSFVSAISAFKDIKPEEILKGLIGVGAIFAELAIFLKVTDFKKIGVLKATGLVILAASLKVFASAVNSFGSIDPGTLILGLAGVAAALGEVAIFTKIVNTKGILKTSVSMTILGSAMLILANAVGKFAAMSWEQLAIGLSGLAGSLGMVAIALNVMPKNTLSLSVGLIAMGAALNVIASALTSMGSLSWGQLAVGLVAMAGSLTIMGVAMAAINASFKDAAVLVAGAAAILVIANAFKILSEVSLAQVGVGLLAIAGALALFVAAAYAVKPAADALQALGSILTGLGVILMGMAALLAAVTFTEFAHGVTGSVTEIAGALSGAVIAAAMNAFIESFANMFMTILQTINDSQLLILESAVTILSALIEALYNVGPRLITVVVELIATLLKELAAHGPEIINAGFDILVGLLKGIADHIGDVTIAAIEIMANFLDALSNKMDDIIDAGARLVISFINGVADGIREHTPELVRAVANLGQSIVDGLAQAIYDGISYVVRAAMDLAGSVWDSIKDFFDIHSPSKKSYFLGDMFDVGLANGIKDNSSLAEKAGEGLANDVYDSTKEALSLVSSAINSDIDMDPVITPVLDLSSIQSGASQIDSMMSQTRTLSLGSLSTNNLLTNLGSISGVMRAKAEPQPQPQTADTKLLDLMARLDTRLTQLGDEMTHLQVVMDTGALVGEISGPLDRSLGWKTTLRNRGV